jgi:hypothetical protein
MAAVLACRFLGYAADTWTPAGAGFSTAPLTVPGRLPQASVRPSPPPTAAAQRPFPAGIMHGDGYRGDRREGPVSSSPALRLPPQMTRAGCSLMPHAARSVGRDVAASPFAAPGTLIQRSTMAPGAAVAPAGQDLDLGCLILQPLR